MPLSWTEIRNRAIAFSKEWEQDFSEDAEAKSFMDGFFEVFGVPRRRVASFEKKTDLPGERSGFIDLLWKGVLLIEFKSRGKDLDRAFKQAKAYFPGIKDYDLPQRVLVCDFERFRLYDLEADDSIEFKLKDFHKYVKAFGFMAGYQTKKIAPEDPVNIEAAERMGKLYDELLTSGYKGHALEVYLVRILFCLFAEDTGIFEKRTFQDFLEQRTAEDGNDLGGRLAQFFHVLNTAPEERGSNLDDQLKDFRYVNGGLFSESLPPPDFNRSMREQLLQCCGVDWSKISPAIFGSLFQSVMDPKARRSLGAHYTSEANIQKLIQPLFMEDLWKQFKTASSESLRSLAKFQDSLASLNFLDPACGCGNFLVVTYRELRKLELEVLQEIFREKIKKQLRFLDISLLVKVNVNQFFGFELEEFPARIAEVALWLVDHQMNTLVSETLGENYVRLPLTTSPNIFPNVNALDVSWETLVPKQSISYIIGNPPFIGSKNQTDKQRAEIAALCPKDKVGVLDYVSGWYLKAAPYIVGTDIKVGFVSTNSICQGEQTAILWRILNRFGVKIHFAHQTFRWYNEASGVAAVYCIIVGFSVHDTNNKRLFVYEKVSSDPTEVKATNINAYLADAKDALLESRTYPISNAPIVKIGNKPIDDGNYLFTPEEMREFVRIEPNSKKWFRKIIGSVEFINGIERWCLWLGDCPPDELKRMPEALKRVEAVRQFRLKSTSLPTRKIAATPTRFHVENFPDKEYLVFPETSSIARKYIPFGFVSPEIMASNLVKIAPDATLYHFGVISSALHMAWVRYTCGRLKADYRYSISVVYNNFPWVEEPTKEQKTAIESAAQRVLDVRKSFPTCNLDELYDPLTMPSELVKAHSILDKAVDSSYGKKSFIDEAERVAFLFDLYLKYTSPMNFDVLKPAKRKAKTDK